MSGRVPVAEVEYDAATGRKRLRPANDTDTAEAAPSPVHRGAAAGDAAANLETTAALHAMAKTLPNHAPTASKGESVEKFCREV